MCQLIYPLAVLSSELTDLNTQKKKKENKKGPAFVK